MEKIKKASCEGYIQMLEGVKRKTLVFGDNTLLAEFPLSAGYSIPVHSHPEEQTGYLVSGHMIMNIDGKEYDLEEGDAWAIPGGTLHSVKIIEDSVAIEVFSPIRKDYLP